MSKLTQIERDELKRHVLDSIVRRLTTKETQEYIKEKMNGLDISFSYLLHIRASLRKDSMNQLQTYQKDRTAFLTEIFVLPVEELKLMKKTLHHIIENEGEDTEIRIKAINQLQSVNVQMLDYYRQLPQVISSIVTTAAAAAENNNNNINNSSTMIVMQHDPTSNNCKCNRCTDLEARF
jgi:hypothetical protein